MGVGNAAVTTAGAMSPSLARSTACSASVMTFPALATRESCVQVSAVESVSRFCRRYKMLFGKSLNFDG